MSTTNLSFSIAALLYIRHWRTIKYGFITMVHHTNTGELAMVSDSVKDHLNTIQSIYYKRMDILKNFISTILSNITIDKMIFLSDLPVDFIQQWTACYCFSPANISADLCQQKSAPRTNWYPGYGILHFRSWSCQKRPILSQFKTFLTKTMAPSASSFLHFMPAKQIISLPWTLSCQPTTLQCLALLHSLEKTARKSSQRYNDSTSVFLVPKKRRNN